MKQLKKTILTLVALLAVTTGAWAQDTYKIDAVYTIPSGSQDLSIDDAASLPFTKKLSELDPNSSAWKESNLDAVNITVSGDNIVKGTDANWDTEITFNGAGTATVSYGVQHTDYGALGSVTITFTVTKNEAATTVTVAWNKTSKTGTFTMPGGNVELEPEYFPQAALTAKPTAINDVPATTDGAIVKAGTVANIGETTTAQGTVMYYVSPTALDDAALLALAADAWTADVPTAESFTAAGTAHVYYYVRGNDSDNDDENFSDGDILSANKLTVTIAAAPTYAVTFAEGIDEPTEWTASPNAGLTKGETVTVTYTGSKKVLGVKAEKKAAAPTLAETLTTAGMTVSVSFLVNGNAETVNFTSNGDGTYTKTGGTGTTATATDWTIQLVENSGMIVFKAYPSVDSENGIMAFRFHFFPSDNTYYMWAGMLAEGLNPTFTSISVNDTAIAVTEAQDS